MAFCCLLLRDKLRDSANCSLGVPCPSSRANGVHGRGQRHALTIGVRATPPTSATEQFALKIPAWSAMFPARSMRLRDPTPDATRL